MSIVFAAAERVIHKTPHALVRDYLGYWLTLMPRTHKEYYQRWLFSYISVRQRWEDNIRGFLALKRLPAPLPSAALVCQALVDGRLGLCNNRAVWLYAFSRAFWADPGSWYPRPGEALSDCRRRLSRRLQGLGQAKISFVLEMLCPASSEVVCLDAHMLKLYGCNSAKVNATDYQAAESHWLSLCRRLRKPSPMVRHIYWDRLRGRADTRYWSYVFEPAATPEV